MFEFNFIVFNDGSTDETKDVLESQDFRIKIVNGDGTFYWAKSMAAAEKMIERVPDGILWVNDDLILTKNAFKKLMQGIKQFPNSVLVGQVTDSNSGEILYGGYKRNGRHPLQLKLLPLSDQYQEADTFNGNFVYIPTEIRLVVGPINSYYSHAYADCDYGYRIIKSGFKIYTLPGTIGSGFRNPTLITNSRIAATKNLVNKKNSPLKSQLHFFLKFVPKNAFYLVPLYMLSPFIRIWFTPRKNESLKKSI